MDYISTENDHYSVSNNRSTTNRSAINDNRTTSSRNSRHNHKDHSYSNTLGYSGRASSGRHNGSIVEHNYATSSRNVSRNGNVDSYGYTPDHSTQTLQGYYNPVNGELCSFVEDGTGQPSGAEDPPSRGTPRKLCEKCRQSGLQSCLRGLVYPMCDNAVVCSTCSAGGKLVCDGAGGCLRTHQQTRRTQAQV
ncbi:hypothetical protein CC80DRAFT_498014 [Byssothecium circinans]|uniref:Uncharacterized protein n=1 Tax=Byssothecium circinans TaxID=147558 RepID=A0A6A5T8Z3_9PLEO|nr:hypothetical protein CC80DRAFT_498014 [Byssothecium circinans]